MRARLGGIVLWVAALGGAGGCGGAETAGGGGGGDGSSTAATGTAGVGEIWTGTLTGSAVGPFVCISGTDGFYDELGTVKLSVPAPGLIALFGGSATEFAGTFSNVETAHENSGGPGCAPQPSVTSNMTAETDVTIKTVGSQVQVLSTTVLVPAHFRTSDSDENLDSKELYLTPENEEAVTASKITGFWFASEGANDFAGNCGGTYELIKQ